MHEIKFVVGWKEDLALAQRVTEILTDCSTITRKCEGYMWQLGSSNDWWMNFNCKTGEVTIAYRYGEANKKNMEALRTTLIWLLGAENLNK